MTTLTKTNSIHRSPLLRGLLLIPLLLACFALLPRVQAAPDPAAIPGGNTRDGAGSLASRTTGINNSAFGTNALNKLTMGNNNAAQGNSAQFSLTDGNKNSALGVLALRLNIHGDDNTAVGYKALYNNTADENVAVGTQALFSNTGGTNNVAVGFQALFSNTTIGVNSGNSNTAIGALTLISNTNGGINTAVGLQALQSNTTGNFNTAVGAGALAGNTEGDNNIAIGLEAGDALTTGDNNIDIGHPGFAAESNTIRIGIQGNQTATFIAGISGVNEGGAGILPVQINNQGRLGTTPSARRFKKEIKPMDQTSEAILGLKPVTFHYKSDDTDTAQFGLIAEEVAEIDPDLVVCNADGEIYTVRYDAVNVMLLNEFLKEHRKVEGLEVTVAHQQKDFEAIIAQQQKEIRALTASLKEQATQIQKVSVQVEMSKPAPETVASGSKLP
jgi:hypothetical protein